MDDASRFPLSALVAGLVLTASLGMLYQSSEPAEDVAETLVWQLPATANAAEPEFDTGAPDSPIRVARRPAPETIMSTSADPPAFEPTQVVVTKANATTPEPAIKKMDGQRPATPSQSMTGSTVNTDMSTEEDWGLAIHELAAPSAAEPHAAAGLKTASSEKASSLQNTRQSKRQSEDVGNSYRSERIQNSSDDSELLKTHSPDPVSLGQELGQGVSPDLSQSTVRQVAMTSTPQTMPAAGGVSASVEEQVRSRLEYAESLVRRGADFAAREELILATSVIATAHDSRMGSSHYTSCLERGMLALREAEDFFELNQQGPGSGGVASVLSMHQTRIIDPQTGASVSPVQAAQAYYRFAGDQIAHAVGQSQVAGDVLYLMGKIQMAGGGAGDASAASSRARAMVMFQASLAANPADHRSANELGVLMASTGRWVEARELFATSLLAKPTAEGWQNIAAVHERLGEGQLAARAQARYQEMMAQSVPGNGAQWVSNSEFETRGAMPEVPMDATQPRTAMRSDDPAPDAMEKRPVLDSIRQWF